MPNEATVSVIVRFLTVVGTLLGAMHLLPQAYLDWLQQNTGPISSFIGLGLVLVTGVYGVIKSTRNSKIASVTSDGKTVVVTPTQSEADSHPSPNVVGPADVGPITLKTAA